MPACCEVIANNPDSYVLGLVCEIHVFKQGVERLPRGGRTRQALLLQARVGGDAAINLAAARAPWLHGARMPGVVTSTGIALGEPPWPFQQQASYSAAGQPQGSSGGHSSGGLRGSPKPRPMMELPSFVGQVATVSPGVIYINFKRKKINGSASLCTRPGAQWSCRNRHQGE